MEYSSAVHVRQKEQNHTVQLFETDQGARIAQLPLNAFPDFWVYAYLVLMDEYRVLIDSGSGFHNSNEYLQVGFERAAPMLGEEIHFADLTHILITHGHIDHFGGLPFLREHTSARIGVHELDRPNISHTEERLTLVARRLRNFLFEAGLSHEKIQELVDIYKMTKLTYQPGPVDFTYEALGMQLGPFEMLHVPGHCAGQVVIRLHDVLFCGDHVLAEISPHQAPEQLALNTGLSHYLQSLRACQTWAQGIRFALGGHNEPITDLKTRINEIEILHQKRLADLLELFKHPRTISEITHEYFGETHGYNVLLALEEAGAHVEYLYQRGQLEIANLGDLVNEQSPIRFQIPKIIQPLRAAVGGEAISN